MGGMTGQLLICGQWDSKIQIDRTLIAISQIEFSDWPLQLFAKLTGMMPFLYVNPLLSSPLI
jgi:hypothetical protein